MSGYVLKRLGQAVIVLLLVTIIMFVMFHLLPGNPARAELGIKAQPAAVAAFDKLQGLNRPIWYQFYLYVDHIVHGNLGFSYIQNESVGLLFAQRFPKTIILLILHLS